MLPSRRPPTHPGEMLLEEFLTPLGISQSAFAVRLGVSFPRLHEIIHAKRGVTVNTALRLARVTGLSAEFWLGLQLDWDLWHELRSADARQIAQLEPIQRAGGYPKCESAAHQTRQRQLASRQRDGMMMIAPTVDVMVCVRTPPYARIR
ncbi:MAG: HigA family addiction module antitoxin [Gemmatimonadaceae bacterium]